MKRALFLTGTLLAQACSPAETPPPAAPSDPGPPPIEAPGPQPTADLSTPAGVWEGGANFGPAPLVLVISLAETADEGWRGVLEAPTLGAAPPPLEALSVDGRAVTFEVDVAGETLRVVGVMSTDGRFMAGDATRDSVTADFFLQRTAAPTALP